MGSDAYGNRKRSAVDVSYPIPGLRQAKKSRMNFDATNIAINEMYGLLMRKEDGIVAIAMFRK